jgi:hypothetical protein
VPGLHGISWNLPSLAADADRVATPFDTSDRAQIRLGETEAEKFLLDFRPRPSLYSLLLDPHQPKDLLAERELREYRFHILHSHFAFARLEPR